MSEGLIELPESEMDCRNISVEHGIRGLQSEGLLVAGQSLFESKKQTLQSIEYVIWTDFPSL